MLENQTISVMFNVDQIGNDNATNPAGTVAGPPNFPNTEGRTYAGGFALDLNYEAFNLTPAFYYYVEDGDIHGGQDLNVISGTVEGHYPIMPELWATLRFDYLDVVDDPGFEDSIRQYVASLAWYFHPNVRFVLEYSYLDAELRRMTTFPFNTSLFTSAPGQFVNANNTRADLEENKFTLGFEFDF